MKEIKNLINNQTLLVYEPEKVGLVTPCMDVYKANIQSDGSNDKLKLIIVFIGYLQNNIFIGYTWLPTASMRTLKELLEDEIKNKKIVHQLDFIR